MDAMTILNTGYSMLNNLAGFSCASNNALYTNFLFIAILNYLIVFLEFLSNLVNVGVFLPF